MTSPHQNIVELKAGDQAPPFKLSAFPEGEVSLDDFQGSKNVVLAFYPRDNTPGCAREMCSFSDSLERFTQRNTVVLGVSVDGLDRHEVFASRHGLNLTLLSDRGGEIGRAYGAVRGDRIIADRVLFVIDRSGIIRHVHKGMPDMEEILEVIAAI
ncbi:MAG: peroxiredoxin [Candidatus Obscuribacterales bacterium]